MLIPVGPFDYRLILHKGLILPRNSIEEKKKKRAIGLCDVDQRTIFISDVPPPKVRLDVFAHELAHAWHALDPHAGAPLDAEAFANLVAQSLSRLDLRIWARARAYLTCGIEARDVIFLPGGLCVPLVNFSRP